MAVHKSARAVAQHDARHPLGHAPQSAPRREVVSPLAWRRAMHWSTHSTPAVVPAPVPPGTLYACVSGQHLWAWPRDARRCCNGFTRVMHEDADGSLHERWERDEAAAAHDATFHPPALDPNTPDDAADDDPDSAPGNTHATVVAAWTQIAMDQQRDEQIDRYGVAGALLPLARDTWGDREGE